MSPKGSKLSIKTIHMDEPKKRMVEQTIKYADGSETTITYKADEEALQAVEAKVAEDTAAVVETTEVPEASEEVAEEEETPEAEEEVE